MFGGLLTKYSYEKTSNPISPYSIVGYCTSYRFLPYQSHNTGIGNGTKPVPFELPSSHPISLSDLPNRSRISQFLILPHHQGQSHGTRLYGAVVNTFLNDPACIEITVEDPNEDFDDLRDLCDYARLTSNGSFAQIRLNLDVDPKLTARKPKAKVPTGKLLNKSLLEKLRLKNKLAPRQFKRLVEMHLLSHIPKYSREAGTARLIRRAASKDPGDKALYYWRLLVKQRVFKQHEQVLKELPNEEKHQKLDETTTIQWMDYERLLERMTEARVGKPRPAGSRGKRKIIDDDEDDDDDEDEDDDTHSQSSKKPKT